MPVDEEGREMEARSEDRQAGKAARFRLTTSPAGRVVCLRNLDLSWRTLRGAPCTWLRGMLRREPSSSPSASPARALDRAVPIRAARGMRSLFY
jgi:hypothetical protein